MELKKIVVQAIVGAVLFVIISVILEGSYGQEIWIEKVMKGLLFGLVYGVFLVLKEKFIKKGN
ncbi:MAG: hypothetical protein Mars2KO_06080 [Maribacter sp.]|uniref:hypothetical protein n=1 Tax=Maribacter sp. 2307UL18-2 TaxID=3386274 RepID=UPI0039BD239A